MNLLAVFALIRRIWKMKIPYKRSVAKDGSVKYIRIEPKRKKEKAK